MSGVHATTPQLVAVFALVLAALVTITAPGRSRRRLTRLVASPGQPRDLPGPWLLWLAAAAGGVSAAVLVGGWAGAGTGVLVAVALVRVLGRLEPRSVRLRREAMEADLPFAADLLGAALRSGAPVARALDGVATAVGGPLGEQLAASSRLAGLGAPAAEVWQPVAAAIPGARGLAGAAIRSADSGSAIAGACTRAAAELRAGRSASTDAAARRAEVLVVLPLGCCFLPAFVLIGIVPVVLGVLHDVLG